MTHDLLTPAEASRLSGIPRRTLARWATAGHIRGVQLPSGRWRYPRHSIETLLATLTPETSDE